MAHAAHGDAGGNTLREIALDYQQSVDRLRACGCRCMLRWSDAHQSAVPLARSVDSEACPAKHYEE